MPFDPFQGYVADQPASIYDVQRRQELAKQLLANQLPANQMTSPLSVIANTLAGGAAGWQNSQAAEEAQSGLNSANAALASALQGGNIGDLVQASGNPFLPQSASSLTGDLIRRRMGIGETYYGTPIAATGPDGSVHYYRFGSLGDQQEVTPGNGQQWAPKIDWLNQGNQFTAAPTIAGAAPMSASGAPATLPINNAQAESDKAFGSGAGKAMVEAPANLQAEQQSVQMLDNHYQTATAALKDALAAANNFTTGSLGSVLNAVPGTPGYDLRQRLETVKAIVGFQTLQDIRNASKTGGGLGQISNFEESLLQAVNGSLDPNQSPDQFKASLARVQNVLDSLNAQAHQNYQQDYQRLSTAAPAAPSLGSGAPNPYVTQGAVPPPTPSPGAGGRVLVYNPATGKLE